MRFTPVRSRPSIFVLINSCHLHLRLSCDIFYSSFQIECFYVYLNRHNILHAPTNLLLVHFVTKITGCQLFILIIPHTHTHTHREINTHCFSTATMVQQTRLIVTLYVHWPSVICFEERNIIKPLLTLHLCYVECVGQTPRNRKFMNDPMLCTISLVHVLMPRRQKGAEHAPYTQYFRQTRDGNRQFEKRSFMWEEKIIIYLEESV